MPAPSQVELQDRLAEAEDRASRQAWAHAEALQARSRNMVSFDACCGARVLVTKRAAAELLVTKRTAAEASCPCSSCGSERWLMIHPGTGQADCGRGLPLRLKWVTLCTRLGVGPRFTQG